MKKSKVERMPFPFDKCYKGMPIEEFVELLNELKGETMLVMGSPTGPTKVFRKNISELKNERTN